MPPVWVVDAFTDHAFGGNPAAVVLLDAPATEAWMQDVAAEMRHSETAFLVPGEEAWGLRWFTPTREVDLCGHATLASAHVLFATRRAEGEVAFDTRSGRLTCRREGDGRIVLDLPAAPAVPAEAPPGLFAALGLPPVDVREAPNGNVLLVLADAAAVRAVTPDFRALLAVSGRHGYIVTAPDDGPHDVVCRYFVPAWGIDEDPVTGSIQGTLGPYWCHALGREEVRVHQASTRGGVLWVRPVGDRVEVAGQAVTVVEGTLQEPA